MAKRLDLKNDELRIASSNASAAYLAELLDLTTVRVSQLCSSGVIPNNGARGKYDLAEAVPAYLSYLRANKGGEAVIQLTLARANKIELENEKAKTKLVKTADALEVFRVACGAWRAEADKLPRRVAGRIAKLKDPVAVRKILQAEFDGIHGAVVKPFSKFYGAAWDSRPPAGK